MKFWRRRTDGKIDVEMSPEQALRPADEPDRVRQIVPGMTPREVVDLFGPPPGFIDEARLFGRTPVIGRAPSQRRLFWIYFDVPEPGTDLHVAFTNGRLTTFDAYPADRTGHGEAINGRAINGWAERVVAKQLVKVEREFPGQPTVRPAWRRLAGTEVMDFVLTARGATPADDGRLGSAARRFGDLDVIVSVVDVAEPGLIQAYLPGGYFAELAHLVDGHGITPRKLDLAHWIIGNAPDGPRAAHLAYLPAERGVMGVMPWDLLSPEERKKGKPPA